MKRVLKCYTSTFKKGSLVFLKVKYPNRICWIFASNRLDFEALKMIEVYLKRVGTLVLPKEVCLCSTKQTVCFWTSDPTVMKSLRRWLFSTDSNLEWRLFRHFRGKFSWQALVKCDFLSLIDKMPWGWLPVELLKRGSSVFYCKYF